jgi:hypothetical protein
MVNMPTSPPSGRCQQLCEGGRDGWFGENKDYGDNFRDFIAKKEKNVLRIGFQNIGGFPVDRGKHKEVVLRCGITKWEFDKFGCAETNIDWWLEPEEDKLVSRTKGWWESLHLSLAYNSTMIPVTPRQFGGTTLFSIGLAAHRVVEKGVDASKLGRWT